MAKPIKTAAKQSIETPPDSAPATECRRCGTCCKKGGPSFHQDDKTLIETGVIGLKYLYTIREGELAYDNIKQSLIAAESDIIKIKEAEQTRACIYFDETKNSCRIYEHRPVECRVLKCWDTREIEKIYAKDRISRKDLISDIEGLWDLVEDHQTRCDYNTIKQLLDKPDHTDSKDVSDRILYMIKYDLHLRSLIETKGGVDPEMADFLLGRPLIETIARFGLNVKKKGETYQLMPSGSFARRMKNGSSS